MDSFSINAANAVDALNSMLDADHLAIRRLTLHREPTNEDMAHHPTAQVHVRTHRFMNPSIHLDPPELYIGMLGVINGIFGVDESGHGFIGVIVEADGTISRFRLMNEDGDN